MLEMTLVIVQHGDAVPREADPERPLSGKGRTDVERLAGALARAGLRPDEILHSGKLRAERTAEILASGLAAGRKPSPLPGLAPRDPPSAIASRLESRAGVLVLVSHLPLVRSLAALLLTGAEDGLGLAFQPGTAAALHRGADGAWDLLWMIGPAHLS